jgi:hypothetical protein
MARTTTHTEDRLAAELATDAEVALLNGFATVEGFRAEKRRYFRYDQPIGDAIYEVTGEDDCRAVIVEALLAACKTNAKLRRTLADAIGKANALGVLFVRGWDVDEAA